MFKQLKIKDQKGFTLIELLVVIGILAILLAVTLIAINPNKHFQDARNAQRQSNVAAILDAIYEYESAHNGNIPPSLTGVTTVKELGGGTGQINTCSDLVPTYLANLPMDPSTSIGTACNVGYDTGYTITVTSGRFTVAAPSTEGGGTTISVTR